MLDGIDIFVTVVDAGSFSGAAERLKKSKSYVSKSVTRLENNLGTRLLNRTTRSISLTDAGRSYFEQCSQIVADAEEAARSVTETHTAPRGLLKVSIPVSYGRSHVASVLPEFLIANPEVTLDIELNDRRVDVIAEGYDVVLRIGELKDSSLIARQISTVHGLTVASPDYWDRFGRPAHPSELADHACITYALIRSPNRWEYQDASGRTIAVDVASRVQCNSAELERVLATAGLGVARIPDFACAEEVDSGLLEPVLSAFSRPPFGVYAVYPHRRHLSPKVRSFVDFLIKKFGTRTASPST